MSPPFSRRCFPNHHCGSWSGSQTLSPLWAATPRLCDGESMEWPRGPPVFMVEGVSGSPEAGEAGAWPRVAQEAAQARGQGRWRPPSSRGLSGFLFGHGWVGKGSASLPDPLGRIRQTQATRGLGLEPGFLGHGAARGGRSSVPGSLSPPCC